MNLYDLNNDNTIINIDGKDMEMKPAICYDKVYDRWLVSKCGKIWSLYYNRLVTGGESFLRRHGAEKRLQNINLCMSMDKLYYEDGSGNNRTDAKTMRRNIKYHKVVIDTWAPLYDNPPEGIVWKEWEIVRKLPTVYNHISKTVVIDHIDDNPANNHLDNLRRVTQWDNQPTRKLKGI